MSGQRVRVGVLALAFFSLLSCDLDRSGNRRAVRESPVPDATAQGPLVPDATAPRPPLDAFPARIERVVDGDTVVASRGSGPAVRVRIIGIDSPESANSPKGEQCHAGAATAYAVSALAGVDVRAAYEGTSHHDRYQRELWHVWLPDGTFFAGRTVELGHARALRVRPHVAHSAYIEAKQQQARAAARGLWGSCVQ